MLPRRRLLPWRLLLPRRLLLPWRRLLPRRRLLPWGRLLLLLVPRGRRLLLLLPWGRRLVLLRPLGRLLLLPRGLLLGWRIFASGADRPSVKNSPCGTFASGPPVMAPAATRRSATRGGHQPPYGQLFRRVLP